MTQRVQATQSERASGRVGLCQRLLDQLDRVANRLGDISVAVELQPLKRELARGHEILRRDPVDNPFLSVVTLVEAALSVLSWKDYTPQLVTAIRQAIGAGLQPGPFRSAEYDAIRRNFNEKNIRTSPMIDLALVDDEDGAE